MSENTNVPRPKPEPSPKFVPARWVNDGLEVWLPWCREKGSALRCTVSCAAGNHARVVNTHPKYNVDKWVRVDDLLVPDDSPMAQ
jgi:hypothetical protein